MRTLALSSETALKAWELRKQGLTLDQIVAELRLPANKRQAVSRAIREVTSAKERIGCWDLLTVGEMLIALQSRTDAPDTTQP
jgi:hypothetical protein